MQQSPSWFEALTLLFCWAIWRSRNGMLSEDVLISPLYILYIIKFAFKFYRKEIKVKTSR